VRIVSDRGIDIQNHLEINEIKIFMLQSGDENLICCRKNMRNISVVKFVKEVESHLTCSLRNILAAAAAGGPENESFLMTF